MKYLKKFNEGKNVLPILSAEDILSLIEKLNYSFTPLGINFNPLRTFASNDAKDIKNYLDTHNQCVIFANFDLFKTPYSILYLIAMKIIGFKNISIFPTSSRPNSTSDNTKWIKKVSVMNLYIATRDVDNEVRFNPKTVEEAFNFIKGAIKKRVETLDGKIVTYINSGEKEYDFPDIKKIAIDYIANLKMDSQPIVNQYTIDRITQSVTSYNIEDFKEIKKAQPLIYDLIQTTDDKGITTSSKLGEIGF